MEPGGYDKTMAKMVINPLYSRVYVVDSRECKTLESARGKSLLASNVNRLNFDQGAFRAFSPGGISYIEFDLKEA